jgi:hypothetical protein
MPDARNVSLEPAIADGSHRNVVIIKTQREIFLSFSPDAKADNVIGNILSTPVPLTCSEFHSLSSNDRILRETKYKLSSG